MVKTEEQEMMVVRGKKDFGVTADKMLFGLIGVGSLSLMGTVLYGVAWILSNQ